jgi:hypothetical protein
MAPHTRSLTKSLIIGDVADEHVAAVVEQLDKRDASATILDTARLETGSYRVVDSWAEVDGDVIDFRQPLKGWIRRLAPPHWRRRTQGASEEAAIRSAWSSLLVGFAGEASVQWLTTIERGKYVVKARTQNVTRVICWHSPANSRHVSGKSNGDNRPLEGESSRSLRPLALWRTCRVVENSTLVRPGFNA